MTNFQANMHPHDFCPYFETYRELKGMAVFGCFKNVSMFHGSIRCVSRRYFKSILRMPHEVDYILDITWCGESCLNANQWLQKSILVLESTQNCPILNTCNDCNIFIMTHCYTCKRVFISCFCVTKSDSLPANERPSVIKPLLAAATPHNYPIIHHRG